MNFLELMYTRATTLLRDVFQYLISGLLFSILIVIAVHLRGCQVTQVFKEGGAFWLVALVVSCVTAYVIGQILYSLSTILFPSYETVWRKLPHGTLENLDRKIVQLKNYLKSIEVEESANAVLQDIPIHLYFELTTFVDRPDLHGRFIERYNVLMYMRRSFSACFFFACVGYILLLPKTMPFVAVEIVFFLVSLLLFRHYTVTKIGFLDRTFASYLVAKQKTKGK